MSWFIKTRFLRCLAAILMVFSASQFCFSQKTYTLKDSTRIYYFLNQADEVSDVNLDSAMYYARSAYKLSKQKKMKRGEGWALLKIGELKKYINRQDSIEYLNLAGLKIASELKDDFMEALGHFQLAQFYMFKNRYPESESHYHQSLKAKFEKDQSEYTAMVYSDLGYLFNLQGNFEKQIEWLLKARRLADKLNDPATFALTMSNLAVAYNALGNNKEALKNLREAIEIRKKIGNKTGLSNNYNSLARILQTDSLPAAIRYQKLAINYAEQTGIKGLIATGNSTMSLLLARQGKKAEALKFEQKAILIFRETGDKNQEAYRSIHAANLSGELGDELGALKYYNNAQDIAFAMKNKSTLRDIFMHKAEFHKKRKDYQNAYDAFRSYVSYKDSLVQEKTQSNIADLQLKYETEKKDNEINRLNIDQKVRQLEIGKLQNQKLTRNVIIGGICLILLLAAVLFNRYQLKKKIEQQQMLINFRNDVARDLHDDIGSTLTSIKILSEVSFNNLAKDQDKAGNYLQKITEQSVHMQQEMSDIVWAIKPDNDKLANMLVRMREFVNHTLEPKNIRAEFIIDELALSSSLNMQQRRDFFLIFKEAINNAAKYSTADLVKILLQKRNGNIVLSISDNGKGFDIFAETSSNGLKNMNARATGLSGYIEIISAPGQGTTIELLIPAA